MKPTRGESGLPLWLTITCVLVLLGSLVFNVIAYGDEGYPTTMVLGGLLGGLFGLDKLIKRSGGE